MAKKNLLSRLALPLLLVVTIGLLYFGWQNLAPLFTSDNATPNTANTSGLTININDGDVISDPVLEITGATLPDRSLTINGQSIPVSPEGTFNLSLQLAEGPNLIIVETTDSDGSTISLIRQVTYTPPGAEPPAEEVSPTTNTSLLALALLVVLAAIVLAVLRRRRPWILVSTGTPYFSPGTPGRGTDPLTIIIELDRKTRLSLHIYAEGKRITTLLNNRSRPAGRHTFAWNGYGLSGEAAPPGKITIVGEAGVPPAKSTSKTDVEIHRK